MKSEIFLLFSLAALVGSCRSRSETVCINPNSDDPACRLDKARENYSDHLGALRVASEADLPQCTANLEGRLFYVSDAGSFKVCLGGIHVAIDVKGEKGDRGDDGAGGQTKVVGGTVAAGESLTLTHDLNTTNPPVVAHFIRNGLVRDISRYETDVGGKSVFISGDQRDHLNPVAAQFSSGNIGIVRDAVGNAGAAEFLIANDEGNFDASSVLQLSSAQGAVRGGMTSSGFFLVTRNAANNLNFRVISESKTLVVNTMDITSSGDVEEFFDARTLSSGNVAIIHKKSASNNLYLTIVNPSNGAIVAAETSVANVQASDRMYLGVGSNTFVLIYEKSTDNHMYAQVFNSSGTSSIAETLVLNSSRPSGIAAVGSNYAIVYVDGGDSKTYTKLVSSSFAQVTAATIMGPDSGAGGGALPLVLNNGEYVAGAFYHEGDWGIFDASGAMKARVYHPLIDGDNGARPTAFSLAGGSRFAVITEGDYSDDNVQLSFFSHREGRLELQVVDANTVRVVNKSSESLPIHIAVMK